MSAPTRIYLVRDPDTGEERLVRAVNAHRARSHVAAALEVTVATQDQLVALLTGDDRVAIEDASALAATADADDGAARPEPVL